MLFSRHPFWMGPHKLKSAPLSPWRYQARCLYPEAHEVDRGASVPDLATGNLGVRTFLPFNLRRRQEPKGPSCAQGKPAITRLTRFVYYTARSSRRLLNVPIHHKRIHHATFRMTKRTWQVPNNFEAKAEPQFHRTLVRAHHKIKLHRPKAVFSGSLQRM